jgi:quinolinate synthase
MQSLERRRSPALSARKTKGGRLSANRDAAIARIVCAFTSKRALQGGGRAEDGIWVCCRSVAPGLALNRGRGESLNPKPETRNLLTPSGTPVMATLTGFSSRFIVSAMVALKEGYDLAAEVQQLKEERNAVILAHNYQVPEIQDVADFVGDSLGLSYRAKETNADVIVFCGVHFMAETAKIVNPTKRVLLPDLEAGCSLSESCPAPSLRRFLEQNADKNYYVIAYINCSAEVKALSDIICTSGNAIKVVENAPADRNLLFVPDQNLGAWVMEKTGRKMDLWRGACYVHVEFTQNSINTIRQQYPSAPVVAHPECTFAVRMLADEVCSTEKMVSYCRDSNADSFIIVTESGMLHRLRKEVPGKLFVPGPTDKCSCADCRFMKKNTLEKLRDALVNLSPEIQLSEAVRKRAELPILRMLDLSR